MYRAASLLYGYRRESIRMFGDVGICENLVTSKLVGEYGLSTSSSAIELMILSEYKFPAF